MKKATRWRWLWVGIAALLPLLLIAAIAVRGSIRHAAQNPPQGFSFSQVGFAVTAAGTTQTVYPWYDAQQDVYYVFLPGFATGEVAMVAPQGQTVVLQQGRSRVGQRFLPQTETQYLLHCLQQPEAQQQTATLVFVRSAQISTVFINTESGSLNAIHADKETREAGSICMINAQSQIQHQGSLNYIKCRGNQVGVAEKQSYNLQLPQAQALLAADAYTDWALISNAYDGSALRNAISYGLAQSVGLAYTTQFAFVDLYANGEYRGLYLMVEPVDNGRLDIPDLDAATRAVNAEPLSSYQAVQRETDAGIIKGYAIHRNPADITGGYLLEMEMPERYETEAAGFVTRQGQSITFKMPKRPSLQQVEYCADLVQQFEDALYAQNGKHPTTGKAFTEYIDLDSWVKKYLLEEVVKNLDSGVSSNYFYKSSDSVDTLLYAGPAWDYDLSLGNGYPSIQSADGLYAVHKKRTQAEPSWLGQLYSQPAFYSAMLQEYRQTFLPALQAMTQQTIDEYTATIASAHQMDAVRWGNAEANPPLQQQAEEIKQFLRQRTSFLSSIWLEGESYCVVTLDFRSTASRTTYVYLRHGETLQSIQQMMTNYPDFVCLRDAQTKQTVAFDTQITQNLAIEAVWQQDLQPVPEATPQPNTALQDAAAFLYSKAAYLAVLLVLVCMAVLIALDRRRR